MGTNNDDSGDQIVATFFGSDKTKHKERAVGAGICGAILFVLGITQNAEWGIYVGIVVAMIGVQIYFRASRYSAVSSPASLLSTPIAAPQDTGELDQLVERINRHDDSQPGFQEASIDASAPNLITITFDDNATAEQYVFAKQLAGTKGMTVEPPNGARVLWRR